MSNICYYSIYLDIFDSETSIALATLQRAGTTPAHQPIKYPQLSLLKQHLLETFLKVMGGGRRDWGDDLSLEPTG